MAEIKSLKFQIKQNDIEYNFKLNNDDLMRAEFET